MPTYKVTLKEMPAQRTRSGRVKLDSRGKPLQSIQVIQDFNQRRDMAKCLANICRIYREQPELFPQDTYTIGNDPVEYSVEQMIGDCENRLDSWNQRPTAHIFRSFIDRHNWIVEQLQLELIRQDLIKDAEYVEDTYRIKLRLPKHIAITQSLQANPLFDTLE